MPVNLKPYYDDALAKDQEVKRIMADMDAAFNEGTPEGKDKALELRTKLDEAKQAAKDANELYVSLKDASNISDSAPRQFVPNAESKEDGENKITRQAFFNLSPADREKLLKSGVKVTE
jgi:hypothetical protein